MPRVLRVGRKTRHPPESCMSSRLRWSRLLLCVMCLWSIATTAFAQGGEASESGGDSVEQARQLFNEGLRFVEDEDWSQAEDRFRRVLALRSSHVASYNLASALVHLGRLVESSELLRVVLRDPAVDANTRDASQQLLTEIEPRIGSLTIRITGDASNASLSVDDKPLELAAAMQAVSVDPGVHHVVLQRDGAVLAQRNVAVGGDAPLQADVTLELAPRIAPETAVTRSEPTRRAMPVVPASRQEPEADTGGGDSVLTKWWLWTGVGAAVAAGVIVALVAAPSSQQAKPVSGDTEPPFVRGRVRVMQ
jgi:hypothetical protein